MRQEDWPERLAEKIATLRAQPFAWGRHDCCTFAMDCIEAITGEDPMAAFRGRYDDPVSATAVLKSIGKGSLYATLRGVFGNPVPPAQARRGDLVLFKQASGPSVLICAGDRALGPGEAGLLDLPTLSAKYAFKVN